MVPLGAGGSRGRWVAVLEQVTGRKDGAALPRRGHAPLQMRKLRLRRVKESVSTVHPKKAQAFLGETPEGPPSTVGSEASCHG